MAPQRSAVVFVHRLGTCRYVSRCWFCNAAGGASPGDGTDQARLVQLLDIGKLPALVEERLQRSVEAEDAGPAPWPGRFRSSCAPLALRRPGAEVDVDGAVRVGSTFV